ncbi:glycosyltransferase family 1 protein [Verrucomicrobia bacterium LW23]|nr:glycosyltransferase family 1 protein [Verrucomicrobia bacterium LW23]
MALTPKCPPAPPLTGPRARANSLVPYPLKICDVTQFYSPVSGGVKRYVHEKRAYIEAHTQDEHWLIVPGAETRHTAEGKDGRLHTITIRSPRLDKTSRYRLLLSTSQVRSFLEDIRPDIIESGDPYHVAWTCLRAGRDLHTPVFGFYHSHFPEAYLRTVLKYGGSWLREVVMAWAQDYIVRLYRQFQGTLVASDHLKELLTDWGVDNTVSIKLGVDTESFEPGPADAELRREIGIPDDAFVLLYVGRLSGEKNIATLLEAFRLVHAADPRFYLVVVGDGPLRRLLPAVRKETHALHWHTYVNENKVLARYYRMANLFVHPGVCETFGLVALESQACGLPVVGIRGSYMDANVFCGLDHWGRANTPRELADAIVRMSKLNLPQIGRAAAQTVHDRFAWKVVFRQLWDQYEKAHHAGPTHPYYRRG